MSGEVRYKNFFFNGRNKSMFFVGTNLIKRKKLM